MYKIRLLNEIDSQDCIELKNSREGTLVERRKGSFFLPYKFLTDKYWSIGFYDDNLLIGVCSFLMIENSCFITDLFTRDHYQTLQIPIRIFDYFYKNIVDNSFTGFFCVEDEFKKFEKFDKIISRYKLKLNFEKYIYTNVYEIPSDSLKAECGLGKQSIKESHFFTDADWRYFLLGDAIIRRIYTREMDGLGHESLIASLKENHNFLVQNQITHLCLYSWKRISFPLFHVYTNRILGWNLTSEVVIENFIKKGYII